ncbi:MAG: 4Fe-4S dicluster domain-containing protein [Pseudomonadota bacterium]
MPEYGMFIDVSKCTGCYSCFLACKDEYCGNDYPGYSASQPSTGHYWMRLVEKERGTYPKVKLDYVPTPCMQCREASCIKSSKNGSVYRRSDGIVIIDPEKAKGQKEIVSSCPYRVIYWNEEKGVPQKCTFCAHLLDEGWKEPRCVETCPTGALVFGDMNDPESGLSKLRSSQDVEILHPEYELNPGVCYVGLPKRFIAGEVILGNQPDECAEGISVTLVSETGMQNGKTDHYGDFEFEGLESNKDFVVKIEHEGYSPREFSVKTRTDINLGEILLESV